METGSKGCNPGQEQGQKGVKLGPSRPYTALGPYPTGTWIYPTLALDSLGLALATGLDCPKIQEQKDSFAVLATIGPEGIRPLSPGRCSRAPLTVRASDQGAG